MATGQQAVRPRTAPNPTPNAARSGGNVRRDFFVYGINFLALAAGAAANGSIQIQADADFELQKLSMFADVAAAGQTSASRVLPLVTVQITDTGTGRQVFNTELPIPAVMGDGQIPFILPTTKIFSANASIQFAVTNFDAAQAYNLRILLIGSKLFQFG